MLNRTLALGFVGALLAQSSSAQTVYVLDDGSGEAVVGRNPGGSFMWLNRFVVTPGGTRIVSVSGAFGQAPNGAAITAHLWTDPNGDGNPYDAVSVSSGSGVTANANTDTFTAFSIPNITLAVGTSFFAGFRMSHALNMWPARLDTSSPPTGESWIVEGNTPNDLSGALNLVTDASFLASYPSFDTVGPSMVGNWMVRANAVPEPATLLALGVGAAVLTARRRRR